MKEEFDIWCPFYQANGRRSIRCEGITPDSRIVLSFRTAQARERQMEIFCRTKQCALCELYRAAGEQYADA